MNNQIKIALAGNPNSGKTTLFNQLTGSNQHVGNFPGVTVDRKDGVIRGGMSSVSELFVAQMQDYLGLGAGHRMNVPGTQGGNWQWRLLPGELTPELAEKIRRMTVLYGRADRPEEQTEEPDKQPETAQEP